MSLEQAAEAYTQLLEQLKTEAQNRVRAMVDGDFGLDQPEALTVESVASEDAIDQAFDRQELNEAFKQGIEQGLTAAQKIGISAQSDVIAGLHKAMTVRHRSRIKSMVYGGLREAGQTTAKGYISFVMAQLPLMERTENG